MPKTYINAYKINELHIKLGNPNKTPNFEIIIVVDTLLHAHALREQRGRI